MCADNFITNIRTTWYYEGTYPNGKWILVDIKYDERRKRKLDEALSSPKKIKYSEI